MKALLALTAFVAAAVSGLAQYLPYDLVVYQIDATGANAVLVSVWAPMTTAPGDTDGIYLYDSVTKLPIGVKFSNDFIFDKTGLTFSVNPAKVGPAIQRKRAQTNSTGDYIWTYTTAYGAGVVPIIEVVAEGGTTVPLNVQIVGVPTNTSVTFKVLSSPTVNVLGILVLGTPAGAQAYLHLTAIAP